MTKNAKKQVNHKSFTKKEKKNDLKRDQPIVLSIEVYYGEQPQIIDCSEA
jgi:hypothetical protein